MEKTILIGLVIIGAFLLAGCNANDGLTPEEKELFGEEGAIAGQAVSLGCKTVSVRSCTNVGRDSNSIRVTPLRGVATSYNDRCNGNVTYDFSCSSATGVQICRTRCESTEDCVSGRCVPRSEPTVNIINATGSSSEASVTTTTESNGDVTVQVGSTPVLEVPAGTDLSVVTIEVSSDYSRVAVANLGGVHTLIVPVNGNGPYVCPDADSLIGVSPTCSGVISYTHAQCVDPAFTACQIEGSSYRVLVSGTGAGQNAPSSESSCYYLDSTGVQMAVGTTFSTANWGTTPHYSGIVTPEGTFNNFCRDDGSTTYAEARGYVCGSSGPYASGEGVQPLTNPDTQLGTLLVRTCARGGVSVGCNPTTNRCCGVTRTESSCEGSVVINLTYTDCSTEPIRDEIDCATISPAGSTYTCDTHRFIDQNGDPAAACDRCGSRICMNAAGRTTTVSSTSSCSSGWTDTGEVVTGPSCP